MNPRQGGKTWPATDAISDASADVDDCYRLFFRLMVILTLTKMSSGGKDIKTKISLFSRQSYYHINLNQIKLNLNLRFDDGDDDDANNNEGRVGSLSHQLILSLSLPAAAACEYTQHWVADALAYYWE